MITNFQTHSVFMCAVHQVSLRLNGFLLLQIHVVTHGTGNSYQALVLEQLNPHAPQMHLLDQHWTGHSMKLLQSPHLQKQVTKTYMKLTLEQPHEGRVECISEERGGGFQLCQQFDCPFTSVWNPDENPLKIFKDLQRYSLRLLRILLKNITRSLKILANILKEVSYNTAFLSGSARI